MVDLADWPRKSKDKDKPKQADNPVPIADRLTLRLPEAVQLSGLPHTFLVESIHQGKLKAITIGRRHYVKRADLNEFVQAL